MSYLYNPKGFYLEDYEIGREYTSQAYIESIPYFYSSWDLYSIFIG